MLQAKKLLPNLARMFASTRGLSTTPQVLHASQTSQTTKEDDSTFELLPPGCSIRDPTYGIDLDNVVHYDSKEVEDVLATPPKKKPTVPPTPPNAAAAAQRLMNKDTKMSSTKKNKKAALDDDDTYVYLPPGCSMVDPGLHFEDTVEDENTSRIHYRDPIPPPSSELRKR